MIELTTNREVKSDLEVETIRAIQEGDVLFLKRIFLVEKKLDILYKSEKENWNWLHMGLLLCSKEDFIAPSITFFIENNVSVNLQDIYGMTPLHYALRSKNIDAAIALLKAGANPNLPNERGIAPLSYINGFPERLDLLQLMLDNGGDVDFFTGQHGILEGIKKYRSQDPKFKPVIELMEKYSKKGI